MVDDYAARAETLKGSGKKLITLHFFMHNVPESRTPNQHIFGNNTGKGDLRSITIPQLKVKLKEAGLLQGGKKLELLKRLEDHIDAQHEKNIEGIAINIEEKAINFELLEAFFEQHVDVITVDFSKIHHGPADPAAMEHLGEYSPKYASRYAGV